MRPTIKKIAELAGVTHATVSMVLNNKPGPSEAMKEKILKIVDEVGYVPDVNARNLAKGKNNTIGIFLLNFPEKKEDRVFYYYMEFLQDAMIEARNRGYTLLFYTDQDNTRSKISYAEFCKEQNLRTAIFLGMHKEDENLEALEKLKTTQVILFDIEETKSFNTIISDSETGIMQMFQYLKENKFKSMAVITGVENAEITTQKKIKEIDYFAEKANIDVKYFIGDFYYKSGYDVGKQLDIKNYDCIFAMNDAMAIGVVDALREKKVSIPEEILVIGFDNLAVTGVIKPTIPSIAHDNIKIIDAIFKIINNEKGTEQILVPTQFIKKLETVNVLKNTISNADKR